MRKELYKLIAILILLVAFSLLVYPTPYYYSKTGVGNGNEIVFKVSRFTGSAQYLDYYGWHKAEKRE